MSNQENHKGYLSREFIEAYNQLQIKAKELKEKEMELRKKIVEACQEALTKNGAIPSGTKKGKFTYFDSKENFSIDFSMNTTLKVDEEGIEEDFDDLSELEQNCFEVKTVYKLKGKESNMVLKMIEGGTRVVANASGHEFQLTLDQYITEKPAAPTIEINLA